MNSRFFLGAYWPARKESIDQCAGRLLGFFGDLVTCDSALSTWYELGRSREQALEKPADVQNQDYLLKLLDRGRNRRNVERKVIEELGFHISLWNGAGEGKDTGLAVTCGLYWVSPTQNASLSNCVTVDLPEQLGDLGRAEQMKHLLTTVVRAWEPEWAGVMSREAMRTRSFDARRPFVDWMVFVPRSVGLLPPPSSVTDLENGSLIVVQPEPPSRSAPEDQSNIQRIEELVGG